MNTYTATFTGGLEISRNSKRTYSHAWVMTFNGKVEQTGFSGSEESAVKAGTSMVSFYTKKLHRDSSLINLEIVKVGA